MSRRKKKVAPQSILGQLGANLIEKIVLGMGYVWRPTTIFDLGVDGEIEICDPVTGEATNAILKVQAKATKLPFQAETESSFEYRCDQRDIDYWLHGNVSVILIICRPETNEAYWVNVKEYFDGLATRKSGKVCFDKRANEFSAGSALALKNMALSMDAGVYFAPLLKRDLLYTNLLSIESFAGQIFVAETDLRQPKDVWSHFEQMGKRVGSEWILKNKMICSFHDLSEYPFNTICDQGTVDVFDSSEWAFSDDVEMKNDFVRLLKECLREKVRQLGIHKYRQGNQEIFYFAATPNRQRKTVPYKSLRNQVSREVFKGYGKKKDSGATAYYRHSAFEGFFVRDEGNWYLEISPTYHFTFDGKRPDLYGSPRLAGIKRFERNPAVLGQLLMWADLLSNTQSTLFSGYYPFLRFGRLATVNVDVSLPDDLWYQGEDSELVDSDESPKNQLALLGL